MKHRTRLGLMVLTNALVAACGRTSHHGAGDVGGGGTSSTTGGTSSTTGGSTSVGGVSGSAGMLGGISGNAGAQAGGTAGNGGTSGGVTSGGTAGVTSGGTAGVTSGGAGATGNPPDYPCFTKVLGCTCTTGGVCGTGKAGDPFRCCNVAADTCNLPEKTCNYDPCVPLRCSVAPSCCIFLFEACSTDQDCGGRAGSCVDSLCQFPCDPSVNDACVGPSRTCQRYGGIGFQIPDNTPCDDGFVCSAASPEPSPIDCVGTDGLATGPDCTRDRPTSGGTASDCPASARICSGSGSALGGNGGPIVGGRCCPDGTACNLASGKCVGNFGKAVTANDVCRSGVCSYDTTTCQ